MQQQQEAVRSIEQSQKASIMTHPGEGINIFPSSMVRPQHSVLNNSSPMVDHHPVPAVAASNNNNNSNKSPEEKLNDKKRWKKLKEERRALKNVKQDFVTEGESEKYDIDNVLEKLGESDSSKKKQQSNNKKVKVERKRSNGTKAKVKKELREKECTTTEEEEDEDDEEEKQPEDTASAAMIDEATAAMPPPATSLNRQTSRSTEGMFTPVIKKHSKWKNKKMGTKDDSGHTYSSSSSASSTTSSSAVVNVNHSSSSALSKTKYNLRRKSALRPSQSFDTMKSATSSVASDDTLEAKEHLDLAADFPPLSASEVASNSSNIVSGASHSVPKWVTKTANSSLTSSDHRYPMNNNNNNSSSSSTFSSSAVIDASDQQQPSEPENNKQEEASSLPLPVLPAPPPDVTVVPQSNARQQCTASAGMLPDIAAQAPNVMNTTASSSGVSSNAGDLTPPQTTLMSEPPSFCHDDVIVIGNESSESDLVLKDSNGPVVILDDNGNACHQPQQQQQPRRDSPMTVEFGFEVNVLDLICNQEVDDDDEAIVSFGNAIVLNSPESGIASSVISDDQNSQVYEDAVKIPNYAQIVQYVAKSWKKVEQELKKGLAQQY